jgi:hypothetical protein
MLLDRRLGEMLLQPLDIGRHVQRLDIDELAELMLVTPSKELEHRPVVGHTGVFVADGGGKEFEEASGGVVAGVGDHRRDADARGGRSNRRGGLQKD